MATIGLGEKVKDTITGFEGVVTGRSEYLFGCVRCLVETGRLQDGKPIEGQWIDEQRLVREGTVLAPAPAGSTGGPQSAPPSRDPQR